jgi:hypothetical protein
VLVVAGPRTRLTPGEIQAANLSSPFFEETWRNGSTMTWQQFVERWENRFLVPSRPGGRRGDPEG